MNAKRHHHHKKTKKIKQKVVRRLKDWHRRLGVLCSLFIIIITLTGVAINHSQSLSLAKTPVTQNWILDHYNIAFPERVYASSQSSESLIFSGNLLWLNKNLILEADLPIINAMILNTNIIAVTAEQLYLLNHLGQVIELQDSSFGLPTPIQQIGVDTNSHFWLKTHSHDFITDTDFTDWVSSEQSPQVNWLTPTLSSNPEDANMVRSLHLNWQTVMLDLHSGRIFGTSGQRLWDLVSICLLFLAVSGLVIFTRKKKRAN